MSEELSTVISEETAASAASAETTVTEAVSTVEETVAEVVSEVTDAVNSASETVTAAADTAAETVTSAVSAAATEAAITLASAATTTTNIVTAVVTNVAADAHVGIADKIAALAAEIKTTKSLWVRIRNTVEIGTLSVLLTKAASAVSSKLDK